jgi:hypothetical protein
MYYLPEPPYFLMFVGFFTGMTCGAAFEATLKQIVNTWYKSSAKPADLLDSSTLLLPFLGICVGICVFLASGVEIFLMNRWVSYAIALPMTIFIGALVWTQLGKLLQQLQKGGSKAIDLDALF